MKIAPKSSVPIVAAVLEQLPKTFDESWIRETWTGGHGRLQLRADITGVSSWVHLTPDTLEGASSIGGTIVRRSGSEVGHFNRIMRLSPNGRLNVNHGHLELNDSVHRSGFASSFNAHAIARYQDAGVDDVTVNAGMSAGGYVWARTGFEMQMPAASRATELSRRVHQALVDGYISPTEMSAIESRLVSHGQQYDPARHLSSITELAQMDIGERVLKGDTFDGIMELAPSRPWWGPARSASGAIDVNVGVASLRASDEFPAGVSEARRSLMALLPEPWDFDAISTRLERATSNQDLRLLRIPGSSTDVDLIKGTIASTLSMELVDPVNHRVAVFQMRSRSTSSTPIESTVGWWNSSPDFVLPRQVDGAIDDALRGAGVQPWKRPIW